MNFWDEIDEIFYYKRKPKLRYKVLLSVVIIGLFLLMPVICHQEREPINNSPDTVMYKAEKILARNWSTMMAVMDLVKRHHFDGSLFYGFLDNHRYLFLNKDGVLVNIKESQQNLLEHISGMLQTKKTDFDFSCDSSTYIFYNIEHFDHRYFTALCYSELSYDQLRNYSFGIEVYPHDSIPRKKDSYFWEIEKNWYIYEPKNVYFNDSTYPIKSTYQWAMDNREKYFYQTYDTLSLIKDEFKRIFSPDTVKFDVRPSILYHLWFSTRNDVYDGDYYISQDFTEGLWEVRSVNTFAFLYTKTRLLDSLYADVNYVYPFEFFYNKKYLKVTLWHNEYLKYVYSELPQEFLEQVFDSKLHQLKDNWYYIDFERPKVNQQ